MSAYTHSASPQDYSGVNCTDVVLTFNDGNRRVCFNVVIKMDTVYEDDELFNLMLGPLPGEDIPDNVDLTPEDAEVTITDSTGELRSIKI